MVSGVMLSDSHPSAMMFLIPLLSVAVAVAVGGLIVGLAAVVVTAPGGSKDSHGKCLFMSII